MHCTGKIMSRHFQKNYKKQLKCVPCVPSCLPLTGNGTHAETLPHMTFIAFVYHVYHCARARIRAYFHERLFITASCRPQDSKKYSRVRISVYMVHMVHILSKALPVKGLLCLPFFVIINKKAPTINIAFQVVDFKKLNLCTIEKGLF